MRCISRLIAFTPWLILACASAYAGSSDTNVNLQLSQSISRSESTNSQSLTNQTLQQANSEYRIDSGDSISVAVYQEPDLSINNVKVSSDGTISFPLLGELQVSGLSSKQLQQLVIKRLADGYLKTPNVTVSIDSHRLYYIKGEVNSPGGYSFVIGLTVEKAVALAGGFSERAAEQDITLVRESQPDQPIQPVSPSTTISPGDVITVGESFF